ncbi:putative glycosyl transferase, family 1 [Plasmopara halstedii]
MLSTNSGMKVPILIATLLGAFTAVSEHHRRVVKPATVLWYAPFLSGGGYCSEAHSYVVALSTAQAASDEPSKDSNNQTEKSSARDTDLELPSPQPFELLILQHGDSLNPSFIRDLTKDMAAKLKKHWIDESEFYWRYKHDQVDLAICHSEPGAWEPARYTTSRCPPRNALYKVGRTMFETDRVPHGWTDRMNKMDEIWVPTKFQEKVFVSGGVRPEAIKVVPEVVDVEFFDPDKVMEPYDLASDLEFAMTTKTTVFLSIFKWEERKAWKVLLKAYVETFTAVDDVVLVLLTNGYHTALSSADDFRTVINKFTIEVAGNKMKELPHIHVLPSHVPQKSLPSLYKAANAFVLPSRGEGWGRPHVEAMAMELPVIATFWSGTTAYMTEENSYPLRVSRLIEIEEGAFKGHKWADPCVEHLKELLLRVKNHPKEAVAKGKQARKDMVKNYSSNIVGEIVLGHVNRILGQVAARKEAEYVANHEEL